MRAWFLCFTMLCLCGCLSWNNDTLAQDKATKDRGSDLIAQITETNNPVPIIDLFIKALAVENLDGVMKLADVPWYTGGKLITKREDLEQWWKDRFAYKRFPLKNASFKIYEVLDYERGLQSYGETSRPLVAKVMKPGDWVVVVQYRRVQLVSVIVAHRGGTLKVVGTGF